MPPSEKEKSSSNLIWASRQDIPQGKSYIVMEKVLCQIQKELANCILIKKLIKIQSFKPLPPIFIPVLWTASK